MSLIPPLSLPEPNRHVPPPTGQTRVSVDRNMGDRPADGDSTQNYARVAPAGQVHPDRTRNGHQSVMMTYRIETQTDDIAAAAACEEASMEPHNEPRPSTSAMTSPSHVLGGSRQFGNGRRQQGDVIRLASRLCRKVKKRIHESGSGLVLGQQLALKVPPGGGGGGERQRNPHHDRSPSKEIREAGTKRRGWRARRSSRLRPSLAPGITPPNVNSSRREAEGSEPAEAEEKEHARPGTPRRLRGRCTRGGSSKPSLSHDRIAETTSTGGSNSRKKPL